MHIDLKDDRRTSRLSLVHLFLWMAVAGLLVFRTIVPFSTEVLLAIVIDSAAITAGLVAIYQATRDAEWVDAHPGHWLAMVVLWLYVDHWLVEPDLLKRAPRYEELVYTLSYLGAALLLLFGMLLGDWGRLWKVALGAHAAVFALAAFWRIAQAMWDDGETGRFVRSDLAPPVDVLAVTLLVIAVLWDFRWKQLRDWKHWVGLICFAFHWAKNVQVYGVPNLFL
ncbi:hypothetical protein [Bremerella alba]|uniref:Transmembrane protein n=1 Tax=Bremerella alba TaxID=980252 RepID=A0A7V9A908_9BACT|nr:hypothetical protein [Bremerella alba]MBA2116972.1 hypothetical protein [Bremerella alba]